MRVVCVMLSIAVISVPLSARAGDKEEVEAKTYFEAGKQAYEAAHYAAAASAFEEAYRLSPKPAVLFSLAQAHRQQYAIDRDPARLMRAIELFKAYLAAVPSGGRHDHAAQHLAELEPQLLRAQAQALRGIEPMKSTKLEAKTQLMITSRTTGALASLAGEEPSELPLIKDVKPGKHALHVEAEGFIPEDLEGVAVEGRLVVVDVTLKEKPAVLHVNAPDGAQIALDGRLVGVAPLATELEVASGRHLVVVMERGRYGFSRELTVGRGEERTVDVTLETTTQRTISYYFLGGGGVLLSAGVVASIVALRAEGRAKDIDTLRTSRQGLMAGDLVTYRDAVDQRDAFRPVSIGLLSAGAAIAVTGALLYFIDAPRVEVERAGGMTGARAGIAPVVLPEGGGGAVLAGSF